MKRLATATISACILASASLVGAQTLQTLVSFNGTNGADSYAGLTLGNDGNFYGTTASGGTNSFSTGGFGTVFKVTTGGTLTTLVSFANTNGQRPNGLTLGSDGNLYGTTVSGGKTNLNNGYGAGTVFKVTTNGILTTLISFANTNGENPNGLTLGNDGNFYGTTGNGGSNGYGTMFKVTTNGAFTTLVNLTNWLSSLTLGNDGNFYGTTGFGGSSNSGTVFQLTTNGTLTTLVSFANKTNGLYPNGLTLGYDGSFYGTTSGGGITNSLFTGGMGTVFRVTTNGTLTTLFSFDTTNGENPDTALTLGNDGNLYGMTENGGVTNSLFPLGMGTVFKVTTNGTLTTLAVFNGGNGVSVEGALTQGNDGNFYGTAGYGGNTNLNSGYGFGTVFGLLFSPVITVQPQSLTNNAGATVIFLVSATSLSPMSFQWQKNGTNLFDGGNISGAITNTLTITGISDSDAATYSVIVSNSYSSVTNSATLTVIDPPIITAEPTNLLVLPGTNVAFGVSLTGSAPFFRYQWRFNRTNLLNATNAIYTILSVATNRAGNYSVVITNAAGSVTSSNAALTVVLSPRSQTNYASSTATFTAIAISPESLNYQWQKNGTNLFDGGNLSGTTNSTLTIANVSDTDAAIYNLAVSDATGSVTTSNATLTVNDLPFVATQPLSQIIGVGSNVTFTAKAYGAPPLVFQWYFGNSPVGSPTSGTNVSSYNLMNVQTNESGNYSVQVINGYDSVMSSNAILTVKVFPPSIGTQTSNQRVMIGSNVSFTVSVSGTPPFNYQWSLNNANILNATNATYAIQSVRTNDAGNYSVVITNSAGSVTSSNALLTVIVPPSVALQFLAGYPVLNLNGMLSNNFLVEYSTNLAGTNWINLLSLTNLPASPYQFLDPAGIVPPARFYRAVMQ